MRRGVALFAPLRRAGGGIGASAPGLADRFRALLHVCLSPDAGEPLRACGAPRVVCASEPREDRLIDALERALDRIEVERRGARRDALRVSISRRLAYRKPRSESENPWPTTRARNPNPKSSSPPTPRPPSREPRHDPGVIEGEATEIHETCAAGAAEPPRRPAERAANEQPASEQPSTRSPRPRSRPPVRRGCASARIRPRPRSAAFPFVAGALGALFGAALALGAAWLVDPRAAALDAANCASCRARTRRRRPERGRRRFRASRLGALEGARPARQGRGRGARRRVARSKARRARTRPLKRRRRKRAPRAPTPPRRWRWRPRRARRRRRRPKAARPPRSTPARCRRASAP